MKIAKIVIGIFILFAAFQGIPTGQNISQLEGGALLGFISMIVVGLGLFIWGVNSKPKNDGTKE